MDSHRPVDLTQRFAAGLQERTAAGLHRTLRPRGPHDGLLDLASNDYLGLSRHPAVVAGAVAATTAYGAGSTGSRLVTGSTVLHEELEHALAERTGHAEAFVTSSGYLANLAAVTALAGPGTLVVSDSANHASIVDACRLSRSRVAVAPHADPDAVAALLAGRAEPDALVVTDAVFSVDGDLAPLARLHAVAREHGAVLVVDEAHGLGVVGARGDGAVAAAGLAGQPDVVVTLTLSKSLGAQGGAVLGPAGLRDELVDRARAVIFDTGLAPGSVGAALAALALVDADRVSRLRERAAALAAALGSSPTSGAVVPVVLGDPHAAVQAQARAREAGVLVGCFRPPSVPHGRACLRATARADLTDAEVTRAGEVVAAALQAVGARVLA